MKQRLLIQCHHENLSGTLWSDNKGNTSMHRRSCSWSKTDLWGLYWSYDFFSEKLNTATKILRVDIEHEANVATSLKYIVSHLPNDLIVKWKHKNYEIVKSGRSP